MSASALIAAGSNEGGEGCVEGRHAAESVRQYQAKRSLSGLSSLPWVLLKGMHGG